MCVKDVKIYLIGLKKKLVLGVLDIEEIRDKDNAIGLKEGGGIKMSNYKCFSHIRECNALHFAF